MKNKEEITFEEAMETFIPEYVECIESSTNGFTINKIYKVEEKSIISNKYFYLLDNGNIKITVIMIGGLWSFKPSTKEAYNAQFVVKEPEFVLPEKWCILVTDESRPYIKKYRESIKYQPYNIGNYVYQSETCGNINPNGRLELTLEQFKKYVLKEEIVEEKVVKEKVIEPLPQFKVIESIETITKVENNEGNQFFIGDVVKSSNGTVQTIESFDYNKAKTNIIAFTNKQSILGNGIGIDKIEHYIEPKVEETLLEKAKRLYPVGTKVKTATNNNYIVTITNQDFFKEKHYGITTTERYFVYLHSKDGNKWAEIIK